VTRLAALALALVGCGSGSLSAGNDDGGDDDGDARGSADASRADARSADAGSGPDAPIDAPGTTRTCKRGVAYNRETAADVSALRQGIGWWYNWAPLPDAAAHAAFSAEGIEFVPMIWTGPPRAAIDVDRLIRDIPADARYLLGFNEPNFGVQANLTPAQAAAAWPQVEAIADARGLTLVSPALNYCGGDCNETDPIVWMDEFFELCDGCRVDHIALHWYACTREALDFILRRFEKYGKPMWLTEFSCLDDPDISEPVQQRYMRSAVPVLEAKSNVFRYAWFIGRAFPDGDPYDLFGAPGDLTPLGDTYVGFDGACQ
jgi:hypothetical protein